MTTVLNGKELILSIPVTEDDVVSPIAEYITPDDLAAYIGGGGGSINAKNVVYDNITYPTVADALDALLYVSPQITSFTNNVGTVEIGSTVNNVTLAWTYNKVMTSASINNGVGSVIGLSNKALTGLGLTSTTTWTLTASDGTNTTNAGTSVFFLNKRYWGVSASTSLNNSQILALSQEFATTRNKAVTYDATGGRYPYYCYPVSFGALTSVTVGGLAFSDYTQTTQTLTNASGASVSYYVTRFNNLQTGAAINVVWA